ncbi:MULTISPECIES: ABC transporter ATP-binding protein [unclassified Haladaptatus]|uniref:ABC transporter ATP-binding protein n=1 Tax=unclassified Haladaptatus TaxID=2622732 RepID=UPI00209BF53F|nr:MULTISPECIES: ABC transporter ATP-binding protein [unclassified Haladaptatus]MCO8246179.1 ABC transporter ATP-binding protein/permease [Haladaptatus sp. AB643]MCO8254201.1 ABC transporter ATP-binding protein/permease [Haladaptatus sp. AB618]
MMDNTDEDEKFSEQRDRVDSPIRRLFGTYGREHWFPLSVGIVASLAAHLLSLLPPVLLGIALDAIFPVQNPQPYRLPLIPQSWIPTDHFAQLWFTVGLITLSFIGSALGGLAKGWGLNEFAQSIQHEVRSDTYDAMQRLDLGFFAEKQTGELMSILNNDVNRLEQFLNGGLNVMTQIGITVVGVTVILASKNFQLALVTLVTVPLVALFTYKFVQIIQPKYSEVRSTVGRLNARLENNLGGIEVIKASSAEDYEFDRVTDSSREYYDTNWDAIRTRITFFPGLELSAGFGFILTFAVGGLWVLGGAPFVFSGDLSPGAFVTFIVLSQRFIWPLAQFGQLINMYQQAVASSERIFGLMDEPSALETDDDAPAIDVSEGVVEYEDVTFGYDDEETVIEDVSLEVGGGETLALVGPTGAGKSTILKLLLRLYDVNDGTIRLDGQDITEVSLSSLRESVGYVSQETFLFAGTVGENIAYGTFDATRAEVIEAAKAAQAHEFIEELPDGYDTEVGERGVKLSGGQRQRVGIARILLQNPAVLILDEATSDVDTETELRIQQSLDALLADRTVLAIAHRLSTIKNAETILVLEDGRVVERGTHGELLAEDGLYADLWGVQAGMLEEIPAR